MSKQRITKGSIHEINIDNVYNIYTQVLSNSEYAFFDFKTKDHLADLEVLENAPILFIIAVHKSAIAEGRWPKVGKLPIRNELTVLPMNFIQDSLNPSFFELYNPNTGEITPATKEECLGLESAAVWEANHVEDRIRDHYNGVTNASVEALKIQ